MGCDVAPRIVEYWLKKSLRMYYCGCDLTLPVCILGTYIYSYGEIVPYDWIVCKYSLFIYIHTRFFTVLTIALHGVKYVHFVV